ncbi:hybrid NRPS/PKS enzyme [Apiospora kogelbergensis]|uniref:hybrid NRPS/PKS enzyme n=1 Tax=Apiospora kogelbergensis TaxID=1337665 RepID=UPI00312DF826
MSGYTEEPIAVIGSGCRFPGGASTPSKLWDLLKAPRDVGSKITQFAAESFYHKKGDHHGTSNVLNAYMLAEDTRLFDTQFFGIPSSEADSIDPQQRLLMEVVYEALESSGHQIEELSGTPTAAYVGVMCNDYAHITYHDLESLPKYAATGTAASILANRISYFFNWTGPSMTIDTACSSSLIATHQAVQSLRRGESNLAVAAGTNLIFGPTNFVAESNLSMLSPTGRSRMWDASADGYARGEGVAAVILKRLSDAIADGDAIECIIRETGANQDGRTPGITMPSSSQQAELIRETYTRAGLSVNDSRCQYFEAHGTGTQAGDPQEAGAIYRAFYSNKENTSPDDVLYVGSIKTVIGHTEGTAGLAGLLKASLSIKHGVIPPNLLFENLNPSVEPYYGNLQILTEPKPWPALPAGEPRRASVNSFGFGGANAHAIIESYDPVFWKQQRRALEIQAQPQAALATVPFLFSANSEKTLAAQIEAYLSFLADADDANGTTNVRDLAHTLSRRSAFSLRTYCSAHTLSALREKLAAKLAAKSDKGQALGVRPAHKTKAIIGIFTGQGAQWARMGYELVQASPFAAGVLESMEECLRSLPEQDRPEWSLREELSKAADVSRVMQGEFSQPLCTAVQVVLVDMLRQVGVRFKAVVGHSSGEIGAAYAAGFLTARDAIRIAYYRGRLGRLASGEDGTAGAMLAVGASMEDASELANLPTMKRHGKFNVAASNSSASVTVSGDKTAIERAQFIFEDEKKFARLLKVDTAYHSHHMKPCASPYLDAMSYSKVEIQQPDPQNDCKWYSSVLGGDEVTIDMKKDLEGQYWVDNLLQPVLFSQALEKAVEAIGVPAMALEVGAHAALKGPASLVIEEKGGSGVPYSGVLARDTNDVETFSEALGAIWANVGASAVDMRKVDGLFIKEDTEDKPAFLKEAPKYAWDHSQTFWAESRLSRSLRLRPKGHHELLGVRLEGSDNVARWRNFIKPGELSWTQGHQIQGQTIFPGAGFAAMAIEAAKALVEGAEEISTIELQDLTISRAVGFMDENYGVESVVTLSNINQEKASGVLECDFNCETAATKDSPPGTTSAAHIIMTLGSGSVDALPCLDVASSKGLKMTEVNPEIFYNSLAKLGYNYSDMFSGIKSLKRSTETCSGEINIEPEKSYTTDLLVHPAPLDVAFQGIFGAIGAPGDGQLWTLMVPTIIRSIRINPTVIKDTSCLGTTLNFNASVSIEPGTHKVAGDVDVFDGEGKAMLVIEGLHVTPVTQVTAKDDTQKMSEIVWGAEKPDLTQGLAKFWEESVPVQDLLAERVAFFYLKHLEALFPASEREELGWHQKKYLSWVTSLIDEVAIGTHPTVCKEWLLDTQELIDNITANRDMAYLTIPGNNLPGFIRGEAAALEHKDFLETYRSKLGVSEYVDQLGRVMGQLSHKTSNMEILEIDASDGFVTDVILSYVGDAFGSYTFTDRSGASFPDMQAKYKAHAEKFSYEILDIEADTTDTGDLTASGYDIIVVPNGLHSAKNAEATLTALRKLLKPGGHLLLLEFTDANPILPNFILGTEASWWTGEDDEERTRHQPLVSQDEWDAIMKSSGFSGIDMATPSTGTSRVSLSLMLTQAVDKQIKLLRQPLEAENAHELIRLPKLLLLASSSPAMAALQAEILAKLEPFGGDVEVVEQLDQLRESHFGPKQLVLSLLEVEAPIMDPLTAEKWAALQQLTEKALNVLWVTRGAQGGENPFSNMMVAIGRCMVHERPELKIQCVDFGLRDAVDAAYVAETLLRLHVASTWKSFAQPYEPAWALEREIRIVNGQSIIPRCMPCKRVDDRYNSTRRVIRKPVSLEKTLVSVETHAGAPCELREISLPPWGTVAPERSLEVHVVRSTLTALELPYLGSLYVVIGKLASTGQKVLALTDAQHSVVSVSSDWITAVDVPDAQDTSLLVAASYLFMAESFLSQINKGTSLLVHEPTDLIASALKSVASNRGVAISFTTSNKQSKVDAEYLHPSASRKTVQAALPPRLAGFLDLSSLQDSKVNGDRIAKHIRHNVRRLTLSEYFVNEARANPHSSTQVASYLLEYAFSFYKTHSGVIAPLDGARELGIADVPGYDREAQGLKLDVIDWTRETQAMVKLAPPEDVVRFRSDKTYWLAGLTGELGLSLTRWMVQRGARHVVMTSRKPNVDAAWLKMMEEAGAHIATLPMDITDEASVRATYETINKTMPAIVGVCNGAMVLNDGLMANQSFEDFNATLLPKVKGTQFLDALFPDPTLDFFMVFSSLAWMTGNIGQCSYASANGFMCGVVEGRRRRGLAGSAINLAGIYGIGYISTREASLMDRLEKIGYSNISEWDYLQFFAEAALAGRPETTSADLAWDIASAVRPGDPEAENPPPWLDVPRFCFFKKVKSHSKKDGEGAATQSVRAQLKQQTTMDGVKAVLQAGLVGTLYRLLSLNPEDNSISPDTSLIELGIDSLIAVDMRFWYTRELDLDLPVLKLLGGATVEDMVEDTVVRLSPDLIANVKDAAAAPAEGGDDKEGGSEPKPEEAEQSADGSESGSGANDSASDDGLTTLTAVTRPESVAENSEDDKSAADQPGFPL